MSGFSRGKPEAGRNELDLSLLEERERAHHFNWHITFSRTIYVRLTTARYESKSCCLCVLKA